jgi:hypothetical protein
MVTGWSLPTATTSSLGCERERERRIGKERIEEKKGSVAV